MGSVLRVIMGWTLSFIKQRLVPEFITLLIITARARAQMLN